MEISVPKNKPILDTRIIPFFFWYLVMSVFCSAFVLFWDRFGFEILSFSSRVSFCISVFCIHECLWISNVLFVLFDDLHWLSSFKISRPRSAGDSPSKELIWKSIKKQLASHLIAQIPTLWLLFPVFTHFGSAWSVQPGMFWTNVWQVFVTAVVNDLLFYGCHVILHHRWFYAKVLGSTLSDEHLLTKF